MTVTSLGSAFGASQRGRTLAHRVVRLGFWWLLVLGLLLAALPVRTPAAQDFLDPEQAFVATAAMADPLHLDIHFDIAPGYYMYQARFELRIEDAQGDVLAFRRSELTPDEAVPATPRWSAPVQLPRGRVTWDPTFEQDMEVYRDGVTLRMPLQAGAAGPLNVAVAGQGCAEDGLCYPPMTWQLSLASAADGYQAQGDWVRDQVPPPQDEAADASESGASAGGSAGQAASSGGMGSLLGSGDTGMAAWLHQAPVWQIIGLSFLFGLLLSLTPCVLPMVPILLAIIAGRDTQRPDGMRGLGLAAVYVLGMSVVYTALGVAAGLVGASLAAWLQSPWVLGSFALLLAIFALAMLDVFTFQVPVGMQSALQARLQAMPGGQAGAVLVMGMVSALIVGPCVAAPLAGVLLFISQTGDVLIGGSALFAMAWGQGMLLLAVGAGAAAVLPRAGAWMGLLKTGFGILLLATAWWMARPLLPSALYIAGWVLLALWLGLLLWIAADARRLAAGGTAGDAAALPGPFSLLLKSLALGVLLWAVAQAAGLLAGGHDMLRPLAPFAGGGGATTPAAVVDPAAVRARFTRVDTLEALDSQLASTDRPVMLDFYADWCVSCLEMEKFTLSDPEVASRLDRLQLLQADVTRMNAEDRALLKRFDLFGPPGIVFFDRQGRLLPEARVIGFQNADTFSRVLDQVLDRP